MSTSANSIAPQTELEAVNSMLAVIGEAALLSLDDPLPAQADMARFLLREQTRELQTQPWIFNREFGYQLAPVVTPFDWTNLDSTTKSLNIFKPPTLSYGTLAGFSVTQSSGQQGKLDLVIRPSVQYQESSLAVPVFYDRKNNCDGLLASDWPFIYIDVLWAFGYEYMPQSARTFVAVRSGRMLARKALGSTELGNFSAEDEKDAYRALRRDQEQEEDFNIFDNADTTSFRGVRPGSMDGLFDPRGNAR